MALKDIWTNKVNDQDFVDADDINAIAESVINLENEFPKVKSPTVSVSAIDGGHRVYITDVNGTKIFDVMDGEQGEDGRSGEDGFSPIVEMKYDGDLHGVVLTITDAQGAKTEVIRYGDDGLPGRDGEDGYTPVRGKDYWTEDDIASIKGYVDEAILGGAW